MWQVQQGGGHPGGEGSVKGSSHGLLSQVLVLGGAAEDPPCHDQGKDRMMGGNL